MRRIIEVLPTLTLPTMQVFIFNVIRIVFGLVAFNLCLESKSIFYEIQINDFLRLYSKKQYN